MAPSIVVLGNQILNIKMSSLKLIIESIGQKVMTKSSFEHRFHNLKYFEVGFFLVFFEFSIKSRAPIQKLYKKSFN